MPTFGLSLCGERISNSRIVVPRLLVTARGTDCSVSWLSNVPSLQYFVLSCRVAEDWSDRVRQNHELEVAMFCKQRSGWWRESWQKLA